MRRLFRLTGLLALASMTPVPIVRTAVAADLPRVHLIATGGTISSRTGGRLSAAELLASIPGLDAHVKADAEQFANIASNDFTFTLCLQLSRRVNEVFKADPGLAGIVVTSGTDTLEEIAYFFDLTVPSGRPVVVVGSMRNPSTLGYEGAANLLAGLRVAGDPASRGLGALVVLNDEINAARDVTKSDALRLQTFQSGAAGVLGVVDDDRVAYYRRPARPRAPAALFEVSALNALPRVDILFSYLDAPGDLVPLYVTAGVRGLVVAGTGAGYTTASQTPALVDAGQKGVVLVMSSRTGSGRVAPQDGPSLPRGEPQIPHLVFAEDLSPIKSRILLMLALTRTNDPAAIQRLFSEY